MSDPRTSAAALKAWLIDAALPRWHATGWDQRAGGFVEEWHADGSPHREAPRRLRVQARQIYSFAHAAHLGWYRQGLPLAMQGFDWLMAKGWSPDGKRGFAHKLDANGHVTDARRDSYDHMFVLLALSWLWKATNNRQVKAAFEQTLAYVDTHLIDDGGTLFEGEPRTFPRRQNPNMHGFEAMLAMHETQIRSDGLHRAIAFLKRFETTFLDPETHTVLEDFGPDWQRLPSPQGDKVEPGHGAEWVWLLRRYTNLSGAKFKTNPKHLLDRVGKMAMSKTGLLPDEYSVDGTVRRQTSRIWTMTEYVKAWIMDAEAGVADAGSRAGQLMDQLQKFYLVPAPTGGWIDQLDALGKPVVGPIPASILYHLVAAVVEADRVFLRGQP